MPGVTVRSGSRESRFASLTEALRRARAGDLVAVDSGFYSPSGTSEGTPIVAPPGVTIAGAGSDRTILDGEGRSEPSFAPIRADLSVLVLADGCRLEGLTVRNGGGHGIAASDGASISIERCRIAHSGQHGLFLGGVGRARVADCLFEDSGRARFSTSAPSGTTSRLPSWYAREIRQGHHIFMAAQHGRANRLVALDNTLRQSYADGVAVGCFATEPDGVEFEAVLCGNVIEESERGGLLSCGSFGPSGTRFRLVATDNTFARNAAFGLSVAGAIPFQERVPHSTEVTVLFAGNRLRDCPIGFLAQGAVGGASDNRLTLVIEDNRFQDCARNAIRIYAAMGIDEAVCTDNVLEARVVNNGVEGASRGIAVQGAASSPADEARGPERNVVNLLSRRNRFGPSVEGPLVVSDGLPGNHVAVSADSESSIRLDENILV